MGGRGFPPRQTRQPDAKSAEAALTLSLSPLMHRLWNLRDKFWEFFAYKLIVSHSQKPEDMQCVLKMITKPVKDGPELTDASLVATAAAFRVAAKPPFLTCFA